jgi:hypothetical protein
MIAIVGIVKRWQQARTAMVVAECGTGKTLISLGALHVHSQGYPFTALAMVPPHLVEKWGRVREVREVPAMLSDGEFLLWCRRVGLSQEAQELITFVWKQAHILRSRKGPCQTRLFLAPRSRPMRVNYVGQTSRSFVRAKSSTVRQSSRPRARTVAVFYSPLWQN